MVERNIPDSWAAWEGLVYRISSNDTPPEQRVKDSNTVRSIRWELDRLNTLADNYRAVLKNEMR